jgi:hypothetical protein
MPAERKKAAKKPARKTTKKVPARKPRKTYVCVPCGMEVTISKKGIGATRLMCCGELMKPKRPRKR